MSSLHDSEIGKTRRVSGYIISIIPSVMIAMSGVMKLLDSDEIRANMNGIPNLSEMMVLIGVIELVCLIFYWIPKTSNLGFFLLCSYVGGIIVAELVAGGPPIPGIPVAILLYVGTFLRKPSLLSLGI